MAEKLNSSEQKISTSEAKRRASLPTLSSIVKSQTSSFQRRSANTNPSRLPARAGGSVRGFLMKLVLGAGAVYLSGYLGVWGEPEESTKIVQRMKELMRRVENEKILSEDFRGDVINKFNQTKTFVKSQVEEIPNELKTYYEKTEKYFNDILKGKKS